MKQHPIRRILLSTAATVSGVVLLLALKSPGLPGTSVQAGAPVAGATAPATGAPGSAASRPAGSGPAGSDPQLPEQPQDPGQQGQPEEPPQGGGAAQRTVTGSAVETDYGVVQVKITLSGERLTAASAVRSPSSSPRSQQITSSAVPRLDRAAVAAQSAEIDSVSGASYTSQGYIASLQSALDKAGV